MKTLYIANNLGNMCNQEFEFVVLETALEFIVKKLRNEFRAREAMIAKEKTLTFELQKLAESKQTLECALKQTDEELTESKAESLHIS